MNQYHIGCGARHVPGWVNVDFQPSPAVDILADVRNVNTFATEQIDALYSNAMLEHLFLDDVALHFQRVAAKLAPGGAAFYGGLPDFWQITDWVKANPGEEWLLQHNIFGHPEKEAARDIQLHKYAVTRRALEDASRDLGVEVTHGLHGWLDEPFLSCRFVVLHRGPLDWAKFRQPRTEYWEMNRLRTNA